MTESASLALLTGKISLNMLGKYIHFSYIVNFYTDKMICIFNYLYNFEIIIAVNIVHLAQSDTQRGIIRMADTFKQLWLMGKGGPWEMRERPIPHAGPGQLVVKMTACSICNQTDLNTIRALHPPHDHQIQGMVPHHFREWDKRVPDVLSDVYPPIKYPNEPYPTTMGHEGTGIVVEVGKVEGDIKPIGFKAPFMSLMGMMGGSGEFKVGDRVSMVGTMGGFGEYIVTPMNEAKLVDPAVDKYEASIFEPCILTNIVCWNNVKQNGTCLILGQGALGLLCTQLARIYGAKTIITSDPQPFKREMSKKFGADIVLDPNEVNVVAAVSDITGGYGVDTILECAGEPETIRMLPYLGKLGCMVGQIGACCKPVTVDWSYIHFRGYTVSGTMAAMGKCGGMEAAKGMAMDMMASGKLDLTSMITHRIPLTVESTNDIFKKIEKGDEVIKAIYVID